jgi:glycerol-3-phosphate acyltransferase PlsY
LPLLAAGTVPTNGVQGGIQRVRLLGHPVLVGRLGSIPMASLVGGVAAVVGHCYSPLLNFRGGAGLAMGAPVLMR